MLERATMEFLQKSKKTGRILTPFFPIASQENRPLVDFMKKDLIE
jgi:hypothetical protein